MGIENFFSKNKSHKPKNKSRNEECFILDVEPTILPPVQKSEQPTESRTVLPPAKTVEAEIVIPEDSDVSKQPVEGIVVGAEKPAEDIRIFKDEFDATPIKTPYRPANPGKKSDTKQQFPWDNQDKAPYYPPKTASRVVYKPKVNKNIIVFVVENSNELNLYKPAFSAAINKIVADNDTALFKFIRIGNNKRYFELADKKDVETNKIITDLFSSNENDEAVNLVEAGKEIEKFLDSLKPLNEVKFKTTNYVVSDIKIVFIGSGNFDDSVPCSTVEFRKSLRDISSNKLVKTIKYFCMRDVETVKAASLGFPIIGHIESDFYK